MSGAPCFEGTHTDNKETQNDFKETENYLRDQNKETQNNQKKTKNDLRDLRDTKTQQKLQLEHILQTISWNNRLSKYKYKYIWDVKHIDPKILHSYFTLTFH